MKTAQRITQTRRPVQRPASTQATGASFGSPLDHLEELIDELIKDNPEESLVRVHMKAVGIRYTTDPVARMTMVLNALEEAREQDNRKLHAKDL